MGRVTNIKTGEVFDTPDDTDNTIADPLAEERIRHMRNKLLDKSDWTQVADALVDKAAWAIYRQELRGITAQAGFPTEVIWPTKPE